MKCAVGFCCLTNFNIFFLLTQLAQTSSEFRELISNYIAIRLWGAIINLCSTFNGSVARTALKLDHERLIEFIKRYWMYLRIHALIAGAPFTKMD